LILWRAVYGRRLWLQVDVGIAPLLVREIFASSLHDQFAVSVAPFFFHKQKRVDRVQVMAAEANRTCLLGTAVLTLTLQEESVMMLVVQ
jgi:hypothetical protein